jgi:hypothetical protein
VLLHIYTAKRNKHRRGVAREEARVCQEVTATISLVQAGTGKHGCLMDDLRQQALIRV